PLRTRAPGYLLEVEPGQLDLDRFLALVDEARLLRTHDDDVAAAARFESALSLWRGAPLADFVYDGFAQTEIARLEELRLTVREEYLDVRLELGVEAELIAELQTFVAEQPLRERPRAQLMLALYRSGRQAEALATYHAFRRMLDDELG